jgi:uncharacterized protein (TIGR02466 family)
MRLLPGLKIGRSIKMIKKIEEIVMFSNESYLGKINEIDNNVIEKEVFQLKISSEGRQFSNVGGWQSSDLGQSYIEKNMPETFKMLEGVRKIVKEIYRTWGFESEPNFDNAWCNVNGSKDYNLAHCHPQSYFSFVYYVTCNPNSGKIVFMRPDLQSHYFPKLENINKYTFGKYHFTPEPHTCIVFPSYLEHFVEPNMSEDFRISISGNFK